MKANTNNIAYLVEQVKAYDSTAFSLLYEESYQKAYFFALTLLKDYNLAERAMEETYIKVLKNINLLKNSNHFIPWVFKLIYSTCNELNYTNLNAENSNTLGSNTFNDLFFNINNERQKVMVQQITDLDSVSRSTLILNYYHGFTSKDIALIMGCSENVVKKRLKASIKTLKNNLENQNQLHIFTTIPLSIALGSSAGKGLANDKAEKILRNSLEKNNFSPDVIFNPSGAYRGTSPIQGNFYKNALFGLLSVLLLLLGVFLFSSKPIVSVTPSPNSTYVKALDLQFTANALLPIKSVSLVSSFGDTPLVKVDSSTYQCSLTQNGDYAIYATAINGKTTYQNITIDNIDSAVPILKKYNLDNNTFTIELTDSQSGLNPKEVYIKTENNTIITPIEVDGTKFTFNVDTQSYTLHAMDKAGNLLENKITIVD
ncbi:MAG: RNA polymerase sigma factor [Filifactoraceae bacterium]